MTHKQHTVTVLLNVYDLHPYNGCLWYFGFGVFHCGVHLKYDDSTRRNSKEYSFLGNILSESTGVFHCEPRQTFGAKFRSSLNMGIVQISHRELSLLLDRLRSKYLAKHYDILTKNCNHFCDDFVYQLTNKHIASWINRMASFGTCCHCCIPQSFFDAMCEIQMNLNGSIHRNTSNTNHDTNHKRKLSHSFSTSLSSWIYSNSYLGQKHNKTKKKIMNNDHQNGQEINSDSNETNEGQKEVNHMHTHSVSVIALNDNEKKTLPKLVPLTEANLGLNPLKGNVDMRHYGLTLDCDATRIVNNGDKKNKENNSNDVIIVLDSDSSSNWASASYQEMPKTPSYLKRSD